MLERSEGNPASSVRRSSTVLMSNASRLECALDCAERDSGGTAGSPGAERSIPPASC